MAPLAYPTYVNY